MAQLKCYDTFEGKVVMNKIRYDIGQVIYKYRKMNRETQDDIGSLIGVSRQMISKIELGETNLSYDKAKILAEHFNVDESDIILESYRDTNDFGDVDEGILCEIRKNV